MIQASELRIGNYFDTPYGDRAITWLAAEHGQEWALLERGKRCLITELIGIPLTEELLLKMGFEQVDMADMGMHTFIDINFDLSINYHNLTKTLWIGEHNTNISTVHGCQNLIYILSGQELTLS